MKVQISQKQKDEAKNVGLTLIERAPESFGQSYANYNLYEFNSCKHQDYFQPTHIRRNHIKCSICLEDEYKRVALKQGLEILNKSDKSIYHRIFKHINCGHLTETTIGSIQSSEKRDKLTPYFCKECFTLKCIKNAELKNLKYLGDSPKKKTFKRYQFLGCLHEKDMIPQVVERGNFECKECIVNEYKEQALKEGLEYLGLPLVYDRSNKRNYKLPCGCTKDLRVEHVKNSRWACDNCSNTHYTKESQVYLLLIQDKQSQWLKFGYAKNLKNRTNSYGLDSQSKITILFLKDFSKGIDALHFEKRIHRKFKSLRLKSKLMEKHQKHNGHTECYPTFLTKDLLKELYSE